MRKNNWLKGAIILGLSFFFAIFLVKPVGVSTQFSVLSGIIHSSIDKNVIIEDSSRDSGYRSTNEYYDKSDGKLAEEIKEPFNYGFIFVLAIPLGAYFGSRLLKKKEKISNIDNKESCSLNVDNKNFFKTYAPSFIGGFILLFGARMADGCTSGHMMSGMMQGSISGYVFAAAVFLTAIPTAIFIKKIRS